MVCLENALWEQGQLMTVSHWVQQTGAKYPVGTEKILIDVDFLAYYLNMLNGPWEASKELTCYPKYMTKSVLIDNKSLCQLICICMKI